MLAAKTIATSDKRNLAAKIQLPLLLRWDNHLALLKLCLYKDSIEKILRKLSNRPAKDMVTFNRVRRSIVKEKGDFSMIAWRDPSWVSETHVTLT
jgi:hypothetical protein